MPSKPSAVTRTPSSIHKLPLTRSTQDGETSNLRLNTTVDPTVSRVLASLLLCLFESRFPAIKDNFTVVATFATTKPTYYVVLQVQPASEQSSRMRVHVRAAVAVSVGLRVWLYTGASQSSP